MSLRELAAQAVFVAAGVAMGLAATASQAADPVIVVDVSDPAAVLVRAYGTTGAGASWSDSSFNGIVLGSFFTGNSQAIVTSENGGILVAGSPDGATQTALNFVFVASYFGGWTLNDLGFYAGGGATPIYVNAGQRPYAGEITVDLSTATGLPGLGDSGPILLGPPDLGQFTGGWQVRSIVRGDYDLDSQVTGRDFLFWQRGRSVTPLSVPDLAEWGEHYGAPSPPASPVPEPTTAALLIAGLLLAARRSILISSGERHRVRVA